MNVQIEHKKSKRNTANEKFAGIGGWLVLPAIGLFLGPIVGGMGLIAAFGIYADVATDGYGGIYTLELLVSAGLLLFWIYSAILFFRKHSNAPNTIISLFVVSLASSCILLIIELGAGAEVFAVETGKQLVKEIIAAAIWIPYFRRSKRVKATFVN